MDAGEYDYIIDNLCDESMFEVSGKRELINFFNLVESWGPIHDRTKDSGFNIATNNGITRRKLTYTFQNDVGTMYEGLILVDRGQGYKLMTIVINTDKDLVEEALSDF